MAMVTTLFFMWGFLTSLNDILIPHLKTIFDLNYAEAMLVQFAFFSAYAAFGVASGKVVEWIGYQRTMVAGLWSRWDWVLCCLFRRPIFRLSPCFCRR